MDNSIVELYTEKDLAKLKRLRLFFIILASLIGACALGVCVYLCASATVMTAQDMLLKAIIVSVAGGWAVITLRVFVIKELTQGIRHSEAVMKGVRECVTGSFTLTKERTFIKKGITLITVKVEGGNKRALQLWSSKKRAFKGVKTAKVYTVYGFIAAYEAGYAGDN